MTNDNISNIQSVLGHYKVDNDLTPLHIDQQTYDSIIHDHIEFATSLANLLTDQLCLNDLIDPIDVLDCLASLGLQLETIVDNEAIDHNWSSLSYMQLIKQRI